MQMDIYVLQSHTNCELLYIQNSKTKCTSKSIRTQSSRILEEMKYILISWTPSSSSPPTSQPSCSYVSTTIDTSQSNPVANPAVTESYYADVVASFKARLLKWSKRDALVRETHFIPGPVLQVTVTDKQW